MVTGISLAHLKLRISEKFRKAKKAWHEDPHHHGTEENPPPPQEALPRQSEDRTAASDGRRNG